MRKNVIWIICILFFLSALSVVFLPYFPRPSKGDAVQPWMFWIIFIGGVFFSILLRYYETVHEKEFTEADKISHTPKTKYGWYGLIFSGMAVIAFYLLAIYI